MKWFLVLLAAVMSFGCAGKDRSAPTIGGAKKSYVPLTAEQKKVLITPTVYYVPRFNESDGDCPEKVAMKDKKGQVIISVCKSVYSSCLLQGTCEVVQSEQTYLLNVSSKVNGERRFSRIENSKCTFGFGAGIDYRRQNFQLMCIDPYYSVAADLALYKLGDVIYVPDAVGIQLPDGGIHDGYFIVRDTGGGIKGHGRFDFFTGFDSPKSSKNPLSRLDFNDKHTHVPYFVISGPKAVEILESRNFPLLPVK